jgi:RHS repeat-associated protein
MYSLDDNGNLVNGGAKTYTYNQANRLTVIEDESSTVTYAYNGDGARLRQVIAGVPTTYTQDLAAPLPVVLQSQTGEDAMRYVYALGTRPLAQYGTAWDYLLADALGSVRQIVDGSGNVTLAESYEPYGSVLNSTGTASSIFAYAGEQVDTSGLVFLRARYMQPTLGIFLARDPWGGDQLRPGSMNGWSYGEGEPVRITDPSGLISCEMASDDLACSMRTVFLRLYAGSIKEGVRSGNLRPVEGFAQFVDYAMRLFDDDIAGMMWGTTHVINGFDPSGLPIWSQVGVSARSSYFIEEDWLPYQNDPSKNDPNWGTGGTWIHSRRGDWRKEFWDKTANQAFHFWFYASIRFFDLPIVGNIGDLLHEGSWENYNYINSPEDQAPPPSGKSEPDHLLAVKGLELGDRLRAEYALVAPFFFYCPDDRRTKTDFDPGEWIRANLKE